MGGNALKNVVTRRYARAEYYQLKERILNKLQGHIDRYDVPREFPRKESFGDLDVLMVCPSSINIRNLRGPPPFPKPKIFFFDSLFLLYKGISRSPLDAL